MKGIGTELNSTTLRAVPTPRGRRCIPDTRHVRSGGDGPAYGLSKNQERAAAGAPPSCVVEATGSNHSHHGQPSTAPTPLCALLQPSGQPRGTFEPPAELPEASLPERADPH